MSETGQDRTEEATPRKREEARKQGQTLSSADLATGLILCFMFIELINVSPILGSRIHSLVQQGLTRGVHTKDWSVADYVELGRSSLSYFILTMLLIAGGGFFAGVFANVMQTGVQVSPEALSWKFSRLSPANGIKKIVSVKGLMRTLMAILKFVLCGGATIAVFLFQWVGLSWGTVLGIASSTWYACLYAGLGGTFCLLMLGVFDFLFQRWQFEDELKMTKQQVKDENKENQGDPKVKGRIRKLQAESAKNRSISEVPSATFVVTNPTHYAIAIRYDRETMSAPKVVAKGKGALALKIRQKALDSGVPILERKPLARALYASTEIGGEIPASLYRAVAEILSYVYKLRPSG